MLSDPAGRNDQRTSDHGPHAFSSPDVAHQLAHIRRVQLAHGMRALGIAATVLRQGVMPGRETRASPTSALVPASGLDSACGCCPNGTDECCRASRFDVKCVTFLGHLAPSCMCTGASGEVWLAAISVRQCCCTRLPCAASGRPLGAGTVGVVWGECYNWCHGDSGNGRKAEAPYMGAASRFPRKT